MMKKKYNFAFFDEGSKREIRRASLKAICIPGYQVPFASRELPIARGWGTGGLQLSLSLVGPRDIVKVIDQGSDESVNAISIKNLIRATTGVELTTHTALATLIQSRHRIPEVPLKKDQILILQVPTPEPLREYEPSERATRRLHAEKEYTGAWLLLFEQIMKYGRVTMKMMRSEALILLGAGREKKIYAIPPYTKVVSLDFDDHPFETEDFQGKCCRLCGASHVYLDEIIDETNGRVSYQCNDTSQCLERLNAKGREA